MSSSEAGPRDDSLYDPMQATMADGEGDVPPPPPPPPPKTQQLQQRATPDPDVMGIFKAASDGRLDVDERVRAPPPPPSTLDAPSLECIPLPPTSQPSASSAPMEEDAEVDDVFEKGGGVLGESRGDDAGTPTFDEPGQGTPTRDEPGDVEVELVDAGTSANRADDAVRQEEKDDPPASSKKRSRKE